MEQHDGACPIVRGTLRGFGVSCGLPHLRQLSRAIELPRVLSPVSVWNLRKPRHSPLTGSTRFVSPLEAASTLLGRIAARSLRACCSPASGVVRSLGAAASSAGAHTRPRVVTGVSVESAKTTAFSSRGHRVRAGRPWHAALLPSGARTGRRTSSSFGRSRPGRSSSESQAPGETEVTGRKGSPEEYRGSSHR